MAKTKAELESDCMQHNAIMHEVRTCHNEGQIVKGVALAVSAWGYINGMIQYERRYQQRTEFKSIDSIDYVLRFAPLLFDYESLNKLEMLLKTCRRIEKSTTDNIASNLANARTLMRDAHRLWNHIQNLGSAPQDQFRAQLEGDRDNWRWIAETWEQMRIVKRIPEGNSYRVELMTRMDGKVKAKCTSCGIIARAPKEKFLRAQQCPKCRADVHFVLIG